jgi:hypothetical protein
MDASKILEALAQAVKALDVVTVTAQEVGQMFQRLIDRFRPGEPPTVERMVALSAPCQLIVDKAAERLAAE